MENLYLLTTSGLGDYYVIAQDPTEAETSLRKIFDDQDYGFSDNRNVVNIKWLSKTFEPSFKDKTKPFLSSKENKLLITKNWK